jgi:hypothetical protein
VKAADQGRVPIARDRSAWRVGEAPRHRTRPADEDLRAGPSGSSAPPVTRRCAVQPFTALTAAQPLNWRYEPGSPASTKRSHPSGSTAVTTWGGAARRP